MQVGEGTQKGRCGFRVLGALAVDEGWEALEVWHLTSSLQLSYFQGAAMLPPTWNHNQVKEGKQCTLWGLPHTLSWGHRSPGPQTFSLWERNDPRHASDSPTYSVLLRGWHSGVGHKAGRGKGHSEHELVHGRAGSCPVPDATTLGQQRGS